MSRKLRVPKIPASSLQHEDWSSGSPVVKLWPAVLWASEAWLGWGTITKAKEPHCKSSLQEPSLTMDAVPLERAFASTWLASLVHETQSRRICGSEVPRSQWSRSVLVRRGKG